MNEAYAVLLGAIITAGVAVVGLVIAKENKISEFRQEWIDGLRADVAALVSTVAAERVGHHNANSARELAVKVTEYRTRIRLRFKSDDVESRPLLEAVEKLTIAVSSFSHERQVGDFWTTIESEAQKILKNEWERVKAGEPRYRSTLKVSYVVGLATVVIGLVALSIFLFEHVFVPTISWYLQLFKG